MFKGGSVVGFLERVAEQGASRELVRRDEKRYAIDQWITDYLIPSTFQYGGNQYGYGGIGQSGVVTTWGPGRVAEISNTLPGYSAALRSCPPAFAAQMVRAMVLSQTRFTFRNLPWSRNGRRTFGTTALNRLERPWPKATTGQMVSMMEWHEGLAGNAYVYRRPDRLRVLRPDYVAVLYGSQLEPDDPAHAIDGELIGYVYQNGGLFTSQYKPQTLLPGDVAHWCPNPDPLCAGIGMSWLTPALRDIQADGMATDHKVMYFKNGATPNMVVKGITAATKAQFDEIVNMLEERHTGVANAYRTLYLTAGADATVVGSNLAELDMKSIQGGGETRISFLSRVPAPILGIAEGLAGSSLNAGNFTSARRTWADSWIYPILQDLAASLSDIVDVPADAELWTDTTDMPILREDAKDAAEIAQTKIATIVSGINGGFEPATMVAAIAPELAGVLKHTGLLSVQLQPPGSGQTPGTPPAIGGGGGAGPKAPGSGSPGTLRSWEETERKFDPHQPRVPGGEHGGEWAHDPSVIFKKLFKFGRNDIHVTAHDDGTRSIGFGGHEVNLTDHELRRLRSMAFEPPGGQRKPHGEGWTDPWDVGETGILQRYHTLRDENGNVTGARSELLVGIKKVAEPPDPKTEDDETWDLTPLSVHIPPGPDTGYDELFGSPGVTMRQKDLVKLAEHARDLVAERVDTGHGKLDVYRDGGRFVMHPADGPAVSFDRKSIKALDKATDDLIENEGRELRPRTEVAEKTISTNIGDVTVRITGEYGQGDLVIITPHGTITVTGAQQSDFFDALSQLMESAGERPQPADYEIRAAGHDVTPGHDELHHYWVAGPGLAEWKASPKPFTTLVALLVEHVKPPKPLETYKRWAAAWFHEVFGFWPGSDLNRVTHGHPPRGHKVGPG